jgi:multidrug efflux pump subunit AcrA (membrane-fusion protein)
MADTPRPSSTDRRLAALFPDDSTPTTAAPWWRRRRTAIAAAVVVALVATGVAAASAFGSSGDSYRTATVATRDVDAVQTGVATIEPVAQATVAFPVSGTVASVNVQVGQPVEASGTLASLDTQALTQTLHAKQAALAQAQLTLSKALAGESVGGVGAGGSGSSSAGTGSSGLGSTTTNRSTGAATETAFRTEGDADHIVLSAAMTVPQLAADQQAVLAAQQQVDAALSAAATALANETSVCGAFTAPAASGTGDPGTTDPGTTTTEAPDVTACQQAITAVGDAQNTVAAAQKALATASSTFDALLGQIAATPPPTAPPTTAPTTGPTTGRAGTGSAPTGSTGSGAGAGGASSGTGSGSARTGGTGGSGSSSSPSAADLVAYQSAVDAASAAVAVAQQSVDQATISSPLAGTVVAVNMKVGDQVTAASSTENVVVQGAGGYEVTTSVSVDEIPSISVGQPARVVPDGSHTTLGGQVVAISVAPASSSTTSTLYRATIGLTNPDAKLGNGATGTVSIVTKQATAALAVPTSAVTTAGSRHFVNLVSDGSVTRVPVQVGVVGTTWTAITSGLRTGQQVVLADESAPLPSSATASASASGGAGVTGGLGRFGGLGGGFGGSGGGAERTNRTG